MAGIGRGWEIQFNHAIATYSGDRFQDLFAAIMERRHKGFVRVRPWGSHGDKKNDGWVPEIKTLFQCYAPATFASDKLVAKLTEDYDGAAKHWKGKYTDWIFVHNDRDGMGPNVSMLMSDLNERDDGVTASPWGPYQLLEEFALLTEAQRVSVLGPALTPKDFMDVSAEALKPLIDALGTCKPDPGLAIEPVPVEKIEANDLTEAQIEFLTVGASRAPLVDHYIASAFAMPDHGDAVAAAVTARYQQLRDTGQAPAQTFDDIVGWVTGGAISADVIANALAIVAYFFGRCQIFEVPS